MPLELIPNQPFIFEQALPDQPCLNNDIREGSQIASPDDIICVQQIITPCTEDVMCDPSMYELGSELLTGAWTVAHGWTSADINHIEYDGANYNALDECNITLASMFSLVTYKISFEITSITGNMVVQVAIGNSASGTTYDAIGTYDFYWTNNLTPGTVSFYYFGFVPTSGDTVAITINSLKQVVADCWEVELESAIPTWTYSYDETTGQGKFCSLDTVYGDLVNTSAYATDGNYHLVRFTITDLTEGGIEVILGGTYLGTAIENGEYSYYGVPTSGGELIFRKSPTFDGCISYVSVDDFGLLDNTNLVDSVVKLEVANHTGIAATDPVSFEVHDNRIIWCFNVSDLTNGGNPIELGCDNFYKLLITVACDEAEPVEYLSTTKLRYNTNGWECSFVVSGYSDSYAFGFYFGSVTAPLFYLTQRLRVLQFAPRYPSVGEEYLYSNGSFARSFAQSGKIRTAWFDYVDEPTHDVIRLQLLSDVLTVDSDVYFAPLKDYEPEWDEHRYNLAQSRVDLVKDETLFNRSCSYIAESPCTTNVVTTPPSTTVAYELIGELDLTNVTASNFPMIEMFNGSYGIISGWDATTLAGRNALSSYFQSIFTGAVIGLNGSVTNVSITYVAPMLQITILGLGNYTQNNSAFAFAVDVPTIASNVIMLQPA